MYHDVVRGCIYVKVKMCHKRLDGDRPEEENIHAIVREAVLVEKAFFAAALPEKLAGMDNKMMGGYIEYVADHLNPVFLSTHWTLIDLGYSKVYNGSNPSMV